MHGLSNNWHNKKLLPALLNLHKSFKHDKFFSSYQLECIESRTYAMAHRTSSSLIKFVPKCRSDGSYASVQCMKGAGCWCSDSHGKPIPNTTSTNGRPKCKKYTKTNIRRSPSRNQNSVRDKRICKKPDQRQFNSNLIHVFHGEYKRDHQGMQSNKNDEVIDWKFTTLDLNMDNLLDNTEYGAFRRLVRKVSTKQID